eukprot:1114252-Pyramimonas_sp.AAC.1
MFLPPEEGRARLRPGVLLATPRMHQAARVPRTALGSTSPPPEGRRPEGGHRTGRGPGTHVNRHTSQDWRGLTAGAADPDRKG